MAKDTFFLDTRYHNDKNENDDDDNDNNKVFDLT